MFEMMWGELFVYETSVTVSLYNSVGLQSSNGGIELCGKTNRYKKLKKKKKKKRKLSTREAPYK